MVYRKAWEVAYQRDRAAGRARYVDAEPTRARLAELAAAHVPIRALARAAALSDTGVKAILDGSRTHVQQLTAARVAKTSLRGIYAEQPSGHVPRVGAVRRVQALMAMGWSHQELDRAGVPAALIEAGGDIVVGAPPPGSAGWRIAVGTAHGDSVVVVHHAAVSTSGPASQSIIDPDGTVRSHVIDTHDGRGSTSALQVSVLAANGATADALATALTLVPRARWPALQRRFAVRVVGATQSEK